MKKVTPDSKLTQIELEIASLKRKRCLHILEEYLLPELKSKSTSEIIESIIEIRDIFFFENKNLLFDFDRLIVEKKNNNFNIVINRFCSLILLSSCLKIRVQETEVQFSLDVDTELNSSNAVKIFSKALERILKDVKKL